ncbi:MAG: hypothetical protein K0U72_13550 [Gammaproteobacteria bacterium]|nr:hypothetical protein [Gammaproteobacteria bacterium]
MGRITSHWANWSTFFQARSQQALPALEQDLDYSGLPTSLARSLAIFQLGESCGGTIVQQVSHSNLTDVDEHFAAAMALFVKEEHRHSNILAMCVRLLGGQLTTSNWTAKLFVFARRLFGLRFNVIMLLAADVIGVGYYQLVAAHLPHCRLRSHLREIIEDEHAHLNFLCDLLRSQMKRGWQRRVVVAVWRVTVFFAAIVVAIDHQKAIRDLHIGFKAALTRWIEYSSLVEVLVVSEKTTALPKFASNYRHCFTISDNFDYRK